MSKINAFGHHAKAYVAIMNPIHGVRAHVTLNMCKGVNESALLNSKFATCHGDCLGKYLLHIKVLYFRNKNVSEARVTQYST